MSDAGLTDRDREILADMAENSARKYVDHGVGKHDPEEIPPVTCHRCDYEWQYSGSLDYPQCPNCGTHTRLVSEEFNQDGRGLTVEMCNAIRAAAADGKSYSEIARLFEFINGHSEVKTHAIGECSHGRVDHPPVPQQYDRGPPNSVTPKECAEIRELAQDHAITTVAEKIDRGRTTVYYHLNGECSHEV